MYTVTPLEVGRCSLGEDHVLGEGYKVEDRITFSLYSFLVEGDGIRALVDLGPKTLAWMNWNFRKYNLFRDIEGYPDDIVQTYGNVFDQLDKLGIAPFDIDYVVITHMHADHHGADTPEDYGAVADFPNAKIVISKTGWEKNLAKRKDGKWNSYVMEKFSDFLYEGEKEGKVIFADDYKIAEGLETIYLGGHVVCSQGVKIATEDGLAIVTSDDVYQYSIFKMGIVPLIKTNTRKIQASNKKLANMVLNEGGILLPCHDPLIGEIYRKDREGWLKLAKEYSIDAAKGYLANAEFVE